MPTLKRDFFRRPTRMVHRYGELAPRADPIAPNDRFEIEMPKRVDRLSGTGRPVEVQQHGEEIYTPPRSAVSKPSGAMASISGPRPDYAMGIACEVPVSTKKRKQP